MIDGLDLETEDAEITHLTMEVLTPPFAAHLGYASGAARTVASPRIAERATRQGTGDQLVRPRTRNVDTLTFFSELFRFGHRSREGIAACVRIQDIHRAVGRIRSDDQIFVLSQLMFGDERIGRSLGHDPYSQRQRDGLFHFWLGVGKAMRLRDLPETRSEFLGWVRDYERRNFEPTEMGHQAAEGYLRGFLATIPASRHRIARSLFVTMMDDPMLECLGYDRPSPLAVTAHRTQWRAFAATTPWRPMRLDCTWVAAFGRTGRSPDLTRIGYGTYDTSVTGDVGPVHVTAEPANGGEAITKRQLEEDPRSERVAEIRIADSWRGAYRGWSATSPTVLLFVAAGVAGMANVASYLTGRLPLAAALPIAVVVLYVLWYVMHEASHRLAHPSRLVNDLIGWVSAAPLFLAFSCFVERHQQHHAHTNDPGADPDFAVSHTPWHRRILGLYFPATYRATCVRGGKRGSPSLARQQRAHDVIVLAALGTVVLVGGVGLLALVVVPPVIIGPIITFTFSYLPHRPFAAAGRYHDTREQHGRLFTLLLFGQNHHLTHHLWVNVPWFRLPRLAAEIEGDLRARGCGMDWR